MLDDEGIKKLLQTAIIKKTSKDRDWHVGITKALRKELDDRLSHWIDIARPENLMPHETSLLVIEIKACILENTLIHLNALNDENNN